jgi:hypothetical protein
MRTVSRVLKALLPGSDDQSDEGEGKEAARADRAKKGEAIHHLDQTARGRHAAGTTETTSGTGCRKEDKRGARRSS